MLASDPITILFHCHACGKETFIIKERSAGGPLPRHCEPCRAKRRVSGNARAWSPERVAAFTKDWCNGMSAAALEAKYDIAATSVYYHQKRLGLPARGARQRHTEDLRAKIVSLKKDGKSFTQIGDEVGLSKSAVAGIIFRQRKRLRVSPGLW